MKKILFFLLVVVGQKSFSQIYNTPDDLYKEYHFTIQANQSQPFVPNIPAIGIDDYVYFEVSNNQISLGPVIGSNYADGNTLLNLNNYKKYNSFNLGSVVCLIDNIPSYPARKMFADPAYGITENNIYYLLANGDKMVNPIGLLNGYVPGNFFLNQTLGSLSFDINDNEGQNNSSSFKISVYIIKKHAHLSRNKFNKCPSKLLKKNNEYLDCDNKKWIKEDYYKSQYFHGIANFMYRGDKNYPGCQCGYNIISDQLLLDDCNEGSFDIAFWKYRNNSQIETTISKHLHLIIDVIPHVLYNCGDNSNGTIKYFQFDTKFCKNENPTLFLFDVSGSMSQNNKWSSAKQSALTTLNNIKTQAQSANISPRISILSFDGACSPDPTKSVVGFTTNLQEVENAINTKIPPPGGATPLPQAIETSKQKLTTYLNANNINKGKLIILTDGESTCGSLRPAGVYSYDVNNTNFSNSNRTSSQNIKYYAVGFDIPPGSAAERDLQYFTQINGGKYVNAQNAQELTSAFQKFNRIFIPKPSPSITTASDTDNAIFQEGISLIYDEEYNDALNNYSKYYKNNATDFNGAYNLALMSEANDLYKSAIKYYEMYLQLNPNANDKAVVQQTIANLKITAKAYAEYNKKVVQSDLEYLNLHFKKIQNGESVTLATEFVGFLNEKYNFYKNLSSIVEIEERLFKTNANEVYKGIKDCADAIKRNPQTWDRDASPIISRTYLNMERLLESF